MYSMELENKPRDGKIDLIEWINVYIRKDITIPDDQEPKEYIWIELKSSPWNNEVEIEDYRIENIECMIDCTIQKIFVVKIQWQEYRNEEVLAFLT